MGLKLKMTATRYIFKYIFLQLLIFFFNFSLTCYMSMYFLGVLITVLLGALHPSMSKSLLAHDVEPVDLA